MASRTIVFPPFASSAQNKPGTWETCALPDGVPCLSFGIARCGGYHLLDYQGFGCSSANTLRIQRFKCGREQLPKGPDVIRHAGGHRWRALPPSETNRAGAFALVQ